MPLNLRAVRPKQYTIVSDLLSEDMARRGRHKPCAGCLIDAHRITPHPENMMSPSSSHNKQLHYNGIAYPEGI